MRARSLALVVLGSAACAGAFTTSTAVAATGDIDPSFNGGQPLTLTLPATSPPASSSSLRGTHAIIDSAGRALVGGTASETRSGNPERYAALARITAGGAVDAGFGGQGFLRSRNLANIAELRLGAARHDAQGRLVVTSIEFGAAVSARYTSAGVLDSSYGDNGVAVHPPTGGGTFDVVSSAIAADGSAHFVAYDALSGGTRLVRAWRIDPNGIPDTAYDTGASASLTRESPGATDPVLSAVDPQGRLVVARTVPLSGGQRATLTRFNAQGRLDTTWGSGGVFVAEPLPGGTYSRSRDIEIAPDGSTFLATFATVNFIAKLNSSGALAAPFNRRAIPSLGLDPVMTLQDDGKVLTASIYNSSGGGSIQIRRLTADGADDPTFSDDGVVIHSNPGSDLGAIAVTPGGRLTAVGGQSTTWVARYLAKDASLAPDVVQPPRVRGVPSPGQPLTCEAATWSGTPTIQVFWDRAPRATTTDDDPGWSQLPVTGRDYTPTATDLGSRIRCRERATNANGTTDGPASSVRVDDGIPTLVQAPTVVGTPVTGELLRCDGAQWNGGPDLTAVWRRDGVDVPGVDTITYRVDQADRRTRVSCASVARNDVGAAAPAASANAVLAVGAPPQIEVRPSLALETTGGKATDIRLTCGTGRWDEDYAQYTYRWEREGAEIAGATGSTYAAQVADLGRLVRCVVVSTNPAGDSMPARSDERLVPLPATGEPGAIYTGGGYNRLDPLNLFAVTKAWQDQIAALTVERRKAAAEATRAACRAGANRDAPLPDINRFVSKAIGIYMSARDTCGVLLRAPADQLFFPRSSGIHWSGGTVCKVPNSTLGAGNPCPTMRIDVPRLNAATPPASITALEQSALDRVKPVQVLWDFDNDGRTDASCDPDAPILRTLPSRGVYDIRAVIVSADSEQTGLYSVSDLRYRFHPTSDSQRGALRDAQPFACKTTLIPPEEPAQPCITEATVGRTRVQGNICPVSARQIPDRDLGGLPASVQRVLEQQALGAGLRARRPQATLRTDVSLGFRALPGSLSYITTRQVDALSSVGGAAPATIAARWEQNLKAQVPTFKLDEAQFAMDQIYLVRGAAKVNGIDLDPRDGAITVLVPSDAGGAIPGLKKMTISNRDVAMALGGVPIGDAAPLAVDFADKLGAAAPTLRAVNLDALKASLLKKLDLGPFKLAGDAKLRMADDGTAFIDALAELKGPFKAGSGPIRTKVTVRATRTGKISLEGVHLEVPKALLGVVSISGLAIDYDGGGLSIKGKLLFPPVNEGIAINKFRTTASGEFQELDVSYIAGAGQGIKVGPGIFIVKLGGGLSLNPDEFRARTAVSFGPSAGGGCPTAGIDADANVHFGPPPFFVEARAVVQLVCIPVGNARFYADTTGLVDVQASASLDIGPIYANAALHGRLQLPNWQIDMRGRGGVRHVFSGEVQALLSNLGLAGCGRVEVLPETPISDPVTVAGGAGVRFSGGRPPFTYAELLANLDLFTGCDLRSWSPFGRVGARAAQAGGEQTFTLGQDAPKVLALEVRGVGGAPKVQVVNPKGETLDASAFGEDLVKTANISGLTDPAKSRTVLFLRGAPGTWTVKPAEGSPAIAELRRAAILPAPKVRGTVGGAGASRILRYDVTRIEGQTVRFVERSTDGQRQIKTVKGGGKGTVRFLTSEGRGTGRTVAAEIVQDGLPRATITVARFSAPPPTPVKPRVTVRRRGATVTVRWAKDPMAQRHQVTVATGRGRRFLLEPAAGVRTAKFGGLAKGEGATVRVVGVSPKQRRGATRVVRVAGSLKASSAPKKTRWDSKRKKARKRR